jgi:hypothetical protein
MGDKYRRTPVLSVETEIITSITVSPVFVETLTTDVIAFICAIITILLDISTFFVWNNV